MANQQEGITISISSLLTPISIVLVGMMIAGAIFFGLKSSQSPSAQTQEPAEILGEGVPPQAPGEPAPQANQEVKTSIDDDAVLGDKETATVAIVEFSDYECPFCKRFADETLPQIKKDYIDTGQVILVFRDLPLPFHNPAAEREAIAAECAQEQGGDSKYFEYHDKIFETTTGNGQEIDIEGLTEIAEEIGLDGNKLKTCLEEENFKDEVKKDASDAADAGISGTPGFVIGKLGEDGSVEGMIIEGALPYPNFKEAIDAQLAD